MVADRCERMLSEVQLPCICAYWCAASASARSSSLAVCLSTAAHLNFLDEIVRSKLSVAENTKATRSNEPIKQAIHRAGYRSRCSRAQPIDLSALSLCPGYLVGRAGRMFRAPGISSSSDGHGRERESIIVLALNSRKIHLKKIRTDQ